jgi:hypothetical protein
MCIVDPSRRIASAFAVWHGPYGAVTRLAHERGVSRQWVYREAAAVRDAVQRAARPDVTALRQRVRDLEQRLADAHRRLEQAIVLDRGQQAQWAAVGQALGVSLPDLRTLLEVLLGPRTPSVAQLGRWSRAAGLKAGPLLAVLDEWTCPRVRQAAADELYVKAPVLMAVEPDSLCWVSGRLTEPLSGDAWAQELGRFPALEQVTSDAGSCLHKGVAELNRQRQQAGGPPVRHQLDHFHTLREGGRGLGRAERAARRAWAAVEAAEAEKAQRQQHGQPLTGMTNRLRARYAAATRALDVWQQRERAWEQTKAALTLVTADGALNTRTRAEAQLAQALPQLPGADFAKVKRQLQRAETLTYLDEVGRQLEALPGPAAVKAAAVRQECLRRRPELLRGEAPGAAALRGVLLVCAVVLAKAGAIGQEVAHAVGAIFRGAWRASSLVECLNSAVRMQQARHRKLTQELLDLKRLYWNAHTFRTGRRRKTTPYQRLGVPWPEGLRWWDVLKLSPEQLRDKLSTAGKPT